jgi:excisionase family DNA binding protein
VIPCPRKQDAGGETLATETDEWLTVQEAGRFLKVHPETIRAWIRERGLPAHKIGHAWRIHRAELNAWVRAESAAETAHAHRHS